MSDPAALIDSRDRSHWKGSPRSFTLPRPPTSPWRQPRPTSQRKWRERSTVTGLHAKLYVAAKGDAIALVDWFGNATEAAVTANAELLVELRSAKKAARIDALIDPVDGLGRHLVPYTPGPTAPEEPTTQRNEAEIALRALVSSTFRGSVTAVIDGRCQLDVLVDPTVPPACRSSRSPHVLGPDTCRSRCGPTAFPLPASRVSRAGTSRPISPSPRSPAPSRSSGSSRLALEGITAQELADDAVVAEVSAAMTLSTTSRSS